MFTRLLSELGVRHTPEFSNAQYRNMPFRSLYGLEKLLKEYGVDSCCFRVKDKEQLIGIPVPYLTQVGERFYVVRSIDEGEAVLCDGAGTVIMRGDEFTERSTGVVMGVYPDEDAGEPYYVEHRVADLGGRVKRWLLAAILAGLWVYLFVSNGIYARVSTVALMAVDGAGLYFSYLLVLKQLRIHTRAGDRVCGVIEKEGCSKVLNTGASSFFGLFHWCEVGFSYFLVSLIGLMVFPKCVPQMALINLCCLPFTFWSIWYQHFRAKAWCTLCVSIQCLLWLQFFCYLAGGYLHHALPPGWDILVLGSCYAGALLLLNRLLPAPNDEDEVA